MKLPGGRAAIAMVAAAGLLLGTAAPAHAEPGDDLTISVLTFGPGDHPFFKFGHNAILVQDATAGRSATGWVYNFGTFAFDTAALIPKFLRGRFKYWLSVSSVDDALESYAAANRSIASQELDLTSAQKWALAQALRENARPEKREYLYDYFRDNCSTRVRDAIDRVVGGAVRQAGLAPGRGSYRSHALRMVADLWPEYVGIYLGLGRAADRPINRWEEAFLPDRLAALLRDVRIEDGAGGRPLVKLEKVLFTARRPAKPDQPPNWAGYFLGVGLGLGLLLAGVGWLARGARLARVVMGVAVAGVGGGFGLFGTLHARPMALHRPQDRLCQRQHPAIRPVDGRAFRVRHRGGVGLVAHDSPRTAARAGRGRPRRGRARGQGTARPKPRQLALHPTVPAGLARHAGRPPLHRAAGMVDFRCFPGWSPMHSMVR